MRITGYETPWPYIIIHIAIGSLSYFYPILWIPILLYNFGQLALGGRFFFHRMRLEPGNTLAYTLYKLAQFGIGYAITAFFIRVTKPYKAGLRPRTSQTKNI